MSWRANRQKYSWPFTRASQILKQKKIAAPIVLRELAGQPQFFLQAQNSSGAPLKTEGVAFKTVKGLFYSTNSVSGDRFMLLVNPILIKVGG